MQSILLKDRKELCMNQHMLHTPEGVRDIYGREYARKMTIESDMHQVITQYGYEDIQTPTFEYFDVFSKEIGTTPSKELYKFFDKEGDTLVLRPDFTPSIARCVAKYFVDVKEPIRLSYMGNTFTNTTNLMGKLKEVTQMGVELINDPSVYADAEIISLVIETLKNTGLRNFQVSIGEVEYFKGLCEEAGLDEETELDLRACISGKNYFATEELLNERNVKEPYRSKLLKVADMFGSMVSLAEAKEIVNNKRSQDAIDRLENLYEILKLYGVEEYISFDLGMLSKYRYYTGMIFKAYTYGFGNAVVTGGRYNNLLSHFGKEASAVGFGMVVDDILEALDRQNIEVPIDYDNIEIIYDPADRASYEKSLKEAIELRKQGKAVALIPKQ